MHGVTLNHELRQQLRAAIDQARRRQITLERRCGGCGADLDNRTHGCRACNDRHRARERRRTDHAWNAEQNRLRAERHHRRRLEQQEQEAA